jgi:hypothetical protein
MSKSRAKESVPLARKNPRAASMPACIFARRMTSAQPEVLMPSRSEFDIIVYGASGYTGRLAAEHLLAQYGTGGGVR